MCLGFIVGVASETDASCPPDGVSGQQINDIVIKFLKDKPQKRHLDGEFLTRSGPIYRLALQLKTRRRKKARAIFDYEIA